MLQEKKLPTELLTHCFNFLVPEDLVRRRKVCRHWHEVVAFMERYDAAFRFQYGDQDLRAYTARFSTTEDIYTVPELLYTGRSCSSTFAHVVVLITMSILEVSHEIP